MMLLKQFFFGLMIFCNFQLAYSCLAMRGNGGGDIPVTTTTTVAPALVCSTCPQLVVKTGSGVGVDEPITQSFSTDANGCRIVSATCASATPGTEVNFFYYNDGVELGSSTATTTIVRNFVCNANGEIELTENMANKVVDTIECISAGAAPVCTTCTTMPVITGGGGLVDHPITQTPGTDATTGCKTLTLTCTTPNVGQDIFFFWTIDNVERGTSDGVTTVSRTLACDGNGDYLLTDNGATLAVDSVRCATL